LYFKAVKLNIIALFIMLSTNDLFLTIKEARDAINRHVKTRGNPTRFINQTVVVILLSVKKRLVNSEFEPFCLRKRVLLLLFSALILVVLSLIIRTSSRLFYGF
jgi:hypothetical protein